MKENGGKPTGNALLTAHGEATGAIAPTLFSAQQPAQEIRALKRLYSYTPKENYVTQFEINQRDHPARSHLNHHLESSQN